MTSMILDVHKNSCLHLHVPMAMPDVIIGNVIMLLICYLLEYVFIPYSKVDFRLAVSFVDKVQTFSSTDQCSIPNNLKYQKQKGTS